MKMLNMIDQLSTCSKWKEVSIRLNWASVDVILIVNQICQELDSRAKAKSIELLVILNGKALQVSESCMSSSEALLLANIVANLVKTLSKPLRR